MRSVQQVENKLELHKELKTKYREFFESQLAIHLLKHPEFFPAVNKISMAITNLMKRYKNSVIKIIDENSKIIDELSQPFFGSCFDGKEKISAHAAFEMIFDTLSDKNPDLAKVMQIHCVFVYRIHDQIEQRAEKKEFVSILSPVSLFNRENRSRVEKKGELKAKTELGISNNPVFSQMNGKHEKEHIRAIDKFEPNIHSPFFKLAEEHNIPVVCGPSGHTASLMLGAKLYGELSAEELREYALACFSFLTAGGNHSFHEVFMVANLLDVIYKPDDYSASIPDSFVDNCKDMENIFPEFLNFKR